MISGLQGAQPGVTGVDKNEGQEGWGNSSIGRSRM
ncbi:MAG: hypothetical protein QOH97_284 [Actinoplanes sp.]|jgi:hypothetical protein|nr:hypothetical protein [Actinoplanes sp.]